MIMNKLIISLLLRKPYFGYILSTLRIEQSASVKEMELITGPAVRLVYNPLWLESLDESAAFGAILHELLHIILLHPVRRGARDRKIWALAGDMAVNENIEPSLLPPGYVTVELINREVNCRLERGKSAEYYYERILEEIPPVSLNMLQRENDLILRFPDSEDITVKMHEEKDLSEINNKAVQCAMEEITRQAAEEGEIPGNLLGQLQTIYSSVDVNWRNVLKKFLAGKGRMEIRKTVRRVSKRFDDMPGSKRRKGLQALIAIDESGSISNVDISAFYKELRIIKRVTRADMQVTRFDTECTAPVPLERYLKIRDRQKRGGTDFRPLFKMADRRADRLVIVFTDGEGLQPPSVKQKVLWVLTGKNIKEPPFGETVRFAG